MVYDVIVLVLLWLASMCGLLTFAASKKTMRLNIDLIGMGVVSFLLPGIYLALRIYL